MDRNDSISASVNIAAKSMEAQMEANKIEHQHLLLTKKANTIATIAAIAAIIAAIAAMFAAVSSFSTKSAISMFINHTTFIEK